MKNKVSISLLVQLLGKGALLFAVYGAAALASELRSSMSFSVSPLEIKGLTDSENPPPPSLASYAAIENRNIFALKEAEQNAAVQAAVPAKNLKLRLVATHSTPGSPPFAIIENSDGKKEQKIFDIDSSIFGGGKLVEVLPASVKIDVGGKIEELKLERNKSAGGTNNADTTDNVSEQEDFTVAEAELQEAMANLPQLLSQARAVPYFRAGKSIGMRLFAIRRGSLYEKLGLKNGDILKTVNDNSLSDPSQALKLFEDLKSERSINVIVERMGEDRELRYAIQ
ncbi:MAG: type II secretion system protein N [bacterium]|nr:type II secretion system protein N [bacterium]